MRQKTNHRLEGFLEKIFQSYMNGIKTGKKKNVSIKM